MSSEDEDEVNGKPEAQQDNDVVMEESQHEENGDSEYRKQKEDGEDGPGNGSSKNSSDQVNKDYVKHPLQHRWTLWYDNPGKRTNINSWADHLQKVTSFDTVEDFWRVFNNIKPASSLSSGSNYHLFKENIEPKWEDQANSKGGKWTVPIPTKAKKEVLDQIWLYAILACIGETFESTDDVCGIVVSIRKQQDRICLWTKEARNESGNRMIGRQLKDLLELPENLILGYQSHEESMKPRGVVSKNRYEV